MGRKVRIYPDAPIRSERVVIKLDEPAGRCRRCKRACPSPPFIHPKRTMTQRCHEYVGSLGLVLPACRIASSLSISTSTVERIVRTQRKVLNERIKPYCPTAIGIDEVRIRGQYRNIIVDLDKNVIVDLLPDHSNATLQNWLNQFGSTLPSVKYITMDQTERYRTIFKARCPQAVIIYDKFHFVRLINRAIGNIYKDSGSAKSTRTKQASIQRRVLCSRLVNLDVQSRMMLDGILANNKDLKLAHRIKEDFHIILDDEDDSEASSVAAIRNWVAQIPESFAIPFKDVISAVNNWRPQVVAMLTSKQKIISTVMPVGYYTNSPTEGLNRIVKHASLSTPAARFEQLRSRLILGQSKRREVNRCSCCTSYVSGPTTLEQYFGLDLCPACIKAVKDSDVVP